MLSIVLLPCCLPLLTAHGSRTFNRADKWKWKPPKYVAAAAAGATTSQKIRRAPNPHLSPPVLLSSVGRFPHLVTWCGCGSGCCASKSIFYKREKGGGAKAEPLLSTLCAAVEWQSKLAVKHPQSPLSSSRFTVADSAIWRCFLRMGKLYMKFCPWLWR